MGFERHKKIKICITIAILLLKTLQTAAGPFRQLFDAKIFLWSFCYTHRFSPVGFDFDQKTVHCCFPYSRCRKLGKRNVDKKVFSSSQKQDWHTINSTVAKVKLHGKSICCSKKSKGKHFRTVLSLFIFIVNNSEFRLMNRTIKERNST